MTILLIPDFLLPCASGFLLAHLLWPDRALRNILVKLFLGIGLGLGLSSILYFLYLLAFAGQGWFVVIQVGCLAVLVFLTIRQERTLGPIQTTHPDRPRLLSTPLIFAVAGLLVFAVSLLSTTSYLLRRRQGDWDAWMMYNRAARFVYRDQVHWLQSFSARMDPIFHADYPLLLALNIASSWETLGTDTSRVPMVQSGLFAISYLGLAAAALWSVKSLGQAALAVAVLWGTPILVNEGSREMADVPLAFFILAAGILIYLYFLHRKLGLLVLAGLCAGLAAWTKNEGTLFVVAAFAALAVSVAGSERFRAALSYGLGLLPPFAVVLYFKLFLAPPSDVLSSGPTRSLQQILDPARHVEIIKYFAGEFLNFGGWGVVPFGILVVLVVYLLLFRRPLAPQLRPAYIAGLVMLVVQAVGYYGIFLITPYDLAWHLSYSTDRLILQVYPLITFLILSATATPEEVFGSGATSYEGAQHAAGD